jgi:pilus assembly protein CpaF
MSSWDIILPFLDPIRAQILDADISEIMCNGDGRIFVERSGVVQLLDGVTIPQQQLLAGVRAIARRLGDDISESRPILDSRLEDGSRVAAVLPPASLGGITLTIRKFTARHFGMPDLVERGSVTPELVELLQKAVLSRRNILISGGTGTGKTTLLNILATSIPDDERIVVIEDTSEIQINKPNLVRLEAKRAQQGVEGVSIRQLLKATLRHRPDRIVVGEIRDGAAYDLLQAMNTGHSGSMSTVHADSARGALQRFASLVLESDVRIPHAAIKANIASAIHLILQIERRGGLRYCSELLELRDYNPDTDHYETTPLYKRGNGKEGASCQWYT